MPYNIILYFCLPYFTSLIVLYFLHSTSVLSFYIDVALTLSIVLAEAFLLLQSMHSVACWPSSNNCGRSLCVGAGLSAIVT